MILADTSAWIEYDRATGSPVDERVAALIAADGPLVVTEPVIMEVVAGARSTARAHDLRRLMLRGGLLHFDGASDFDAAALIHRSCRQAGITPRGMIDCMIAAVAWRHGAALLASTSTSNASPLSSASNSTTHHITGNGPLSAPPTSAASWWSGNRRSRAGWTARYLRRRVVRAGRGPLPQPVGIGTQVRSDCYWSEVCRTPWASLSSSWPRASWRRLACWRSRR